MKFLFIVVVAFLLGCATRKKEPESKCRGYYWKADMSLQAATILEDSIGIYRLSSPERYKAVVERYKEAMEDFITQAYGYLDCITVNDERSEEVRKKLKIDLMKLEIDWQAEKQRL